MMMMDHCAMDDRVKILSNATNPYSNIVYHSGHKNPFDRQFELAVKNARTSGLNYPTSSLTTINNQSHQAFNQSPLNTPLIPPDSAIGFPSSQPVLNTSSNGLGNELTNVLPLLTNDNPSPAITTAQLTEQLVSFETEQLVHQNHQNNNNNNNNSQQQPDSTELTTVTTEGITNNNDNNNNNNNDNDDVLKSKTITSTTTEDFKPDNKLQTTKKETRSNVVSVICPPVPGTFRDESKCRSAPIILEKIETTTTTAITPKKRKNVPLLSGIPNDVNNYAINENGVNNLQYSEPGSTSHESTIQDNITAIDYELNNVGLIPGKRILPKQLPIIDSSSNHSSPSSLSSSTETILSNQYSTTITTTKTSLPHPNKRKEKTLDELISKIKATEAALPPKAKPGRKSKTSTTEEDFKEKKRLSLERNRAAAMRCRLKKKKEIDELKHKVEEYEKQNNHLNSIINSLHIEVANLKKQLLKHKDCN